MRTFQCSSTSRNCRNIALCRQRLVAMGFQCSSTSRNCRNACCHRRTVAPCAIVSVLFNEPKLPKSVIAASACPVPERFQCSSTSRNCRNLEHFCGGVVVYPVSVLFNEPKLPKFVSPRRRSALPIRFSALQRAEIAEIVTGLAQTLEGRVSVLFNEPKLPKWS